jgi:hypothetical protein
MKRALYALCSSIAAAALASVAVLPASAAPEPPGPGGVSDSALLAVIGSAGDDVVSTTDLTTLLDPTGMSGTQHYGPYSSGSTDSGTCGNDWASDTFDRHFTVHSNPDGTITVIEQFKNGSFVTPASDSPPMNYSPGACQNSVTPAGIVNNGVSGDLHGYFVIPIPAGVIQTSSNAYCDAIAMTNANCDTMTFINTHFTPCYYAGTIPCSVTTFFFHYSAGDQSLIYHEWKNASPDRGGNSGDIRSTNL